MSSAKHHFEEMHSGINGDKSQELDGKLMSLFVDTVSKIKYKNRHETRKQFSNVVDGFYNDFIKQFTKDIEHADGENYFKSFYAMEQNVNSPSDINGEVWSIMIKQFTDEVVSS